MHTPSVAYATTAVRPSWSALPPAVQAAISSRVGVAAAGPTAGGGFSGGYAAVIGDTFVKAASWVDNPPIAAHYAREARINAVLPEEVPAPRLRWTTEVDDWVLLGLDAVPGARMPNQPWLTGELQRTLTGWDLAAEALTEPPPALLDAGLVTAEEEFGPAFAGWRRIAAGELSAELLPPWFPKTLIAPLAHLEDGWVAATAGTSVAHSDLRRDNVILDSSGAAWFCDWNWPCLAASWFDLAPFLITAHAEGHDTDTLFQARPCAAGVTPEQLDALLAAVAGYWFVAGAQPRVPLTSPLLRQHQRWSGEATLRWLASRRGWLLR